MPGPLSFKYPAHFFLSTPLFFFCKPFFGFVPNLFLMFLFLFDFFFILSVRPLFLHPSFGIIKIVCLLKLFNHIFLLGLIINVSVL